MKKLLLLCSLTALSIPGLCIAQDSIEQCYKSATTTSAVRECLKKELQQSRDEYREAMEKLTQQAGELDRVTGRNEALPALEKANTAFDRYVSEQCRFEETMMGGGTAAGAANLACQINLLHVRMGAIESHLSAQ
mgnify:FL=1